MKSRVFNHLGDHDRSRVTCTLEATLDALPDLARTCTGWGDRGRNFMEFRHPRATGSSQHEIHLTIDAEQTVLRFWSMIDGRRFRTTIVGAIDGIRHTRGETMEDAVERVRGWLAEVRNVTDAGLEEAYRGARRRASAALLAAACRRDDGWSSAMAEMGSIDSPSRIMLGYADDRRLARYCGSSEPPCEGRLSTELRTPLRSETPKRHVVSTRTVADPGPILGSARPRSSTTGATTYRPSRASQPSRRRSTRGSN